MNAPQNSNVPLKYHLPRLAASTDPTCPGHSHADSHWSLIGWDLTTLCSSASHIRLSVTKCLNRTAHAFPHCKKFAKQFFCFCKSFC